MGTSTLLNRLIPVLFEDDRLLAIAKPAGVDVGGASGAAKAGLVETLARVRGTHEPLEPANRLSRFESGVLLLGKDHDIAHTLRSALRTGKVGQHYVALVQGRIRQPHITIDGGSDRQERPRKRKGKARRPSGSASRGRSSKTVIDVVKQHERLTFIRCHTRAPSTHALRAQFRSIGARLLGDSLHASSNRTRQPQKTRLHLERVTFQHPGTGKRVVLTARLPEGFDDPEKRTHEAERALQAALTRRLTCVTSRDTNAYRLLTGNVEGIKGLVAERYGSVVVLQVSRRDEALGASLAPIGRWYRSVLGVEAVYTKYFVKDRLTTDEQLAESHCDAKPLIGKAVAPEIQILEYGLKFGIRPYDGFSVGLFLDHRENRKRVRAMARGKDVLNLFAYTCGFSVAAAAGGARSTVSVDISRKYLEWGRANFELNGLDPAEHDFVTSDASVFLKGAQRRKRRFGLIVLDPPTFAHGKRRGSRFSVQHDLADLIAAAVAVLEPGGILMVATSYRQASLRWLSDQVRQAAGNRRWKTIEKPPLPPDFIVDPDHAKTIFVSVS